MPAGTQGEKSSTHRGSRVLSKLNQILASDVGFVEPVDDLGASESAGFIKKRKACDEAELLRALGAFAESSPRALRGDLSVHVTLHSS
jgi:hypothetical protein